MNIYTYIGSFFALGFGLIWMYTLGVVLYLKAEAYVHGRPAMRTEYLRLLLEGVTEGKPEMWTDDRREYQAAGLDHTRALTGENVAGIIFIGLLIVFGTLLVWPISLIVIGLRVLRRYNTDEEFHKLFENESKPKQTKIPPSEYKLKL